MIRGLALIRGATAAISRSKAAMAADVHLSWTSIAFSHSMTIVTAGSGLKAALVVGLAMAQANIGSAMRQASPLLDLEIVAPFAFA
jgi:hypothetical protein